MARKLEELKLTSSGPPTEGEIYRYVEENSVKDRKELVGSSVIVKFKEGCFTGVIKSCSEENENEYLIHYEDGNREWIELPDDDVIILRSPPYLSTDSLPQLCNKRTEKGVVVGYNVEDGLHEVKSQEGKIDKVLLCAKNKLRRQIPESVRLNKGSLLFEEFISRLR